MLFLGTEKYPDENSYNQYLSAHGGRSNAFTSMTDTNYYFDVGAPYFHEALDRFAQFFIAPLFTPSATEREMNAVDSENAKNLQSDQWRFHQLYKTFSRKDHPYHKFGTGNLYTLKEYPKSKGIDIREALLEFHATYYSASIMKLVVYARESLDELEQLVAPMFSGIKNTDRSNPVFEGTPFDVNEGLRVDVAPVKDLSLVEMVWPIHSIRAFYCAKPDRYLSHLIGHEGKGSLLSLLKARGWANELSAGVSKDEEEWAVFSVTVEATKEGIDHVYGIVDTVYQYISMMKDEGAMQWIFDETRDIANMEFRFRNKETPINYTSSLAGRMQKYPIAHVVSGSSLLREFEPRRITELLNQLVPSSMRLMVVSSIFEGKTESVEKWYQTPYTRSTIPNEFHEKWRNMPWDKNTLHLPHRNDFISTDFELKHPAITSAVPTLNLDTNRCRVWFKFDNDW